MGNKVRRSFSFERGEKGLINRMYRAFVDKHQATHYRSTDYFLSITSCFTAQGMARMLNLATKYSVELMTHPRIDAEYRLLMSASFAEQIAQVDLRDHTFRLSPINS